MKEEKKLMALDHFSRATSIDEAIRVLIHPYTYEMTGADTQTQAKQLMMGKVISENLAKLRDKLIETGIQFWGDAYPTSSTVREGPPPQSVQPKKEEGYE